MPFTKVAAAGIDTTGSVIIQNLNTSGIITATTFVANNTGTTGTPQQTLQVSGGGYFSGSVGLGNTNPAYTLSVTSTGTTAISGLTNCIADFTTSANSYTQINIRNANSGVIASADYVATADNGNDTTNFIDLGINNSSFFSPTWTINGANDGYLYTSDGNLSIGAASSKYLSFFTGGTLAANERARFDSSGNFLIGATSATGTASQKLQVTGGAYVSGSVGIGTTNPGYRLDVQDAINIRKDGSNFSNLYFNGTGTRIRYNDATGHLSFFTNSTERAYVGYLGAFYIISGGLNVSGGDISVSGADRSIINTDNNALILGTNNTERVRITSSSNVGIGTTNPVSRVEIYDTSTNTYADNAGVNIGPLQIRTVNNSGIAGQTAAIRLASSSNSGTQNAVSVIANISEANASNNSSLAFQTRGSDGVVERMRINSSGNLGIGTVIPLLRLSVDGGVDTTFTNLPANLQLVNRGTIAAGLGAGINFAANYNNLIVTTYAQISGARENATSGSTAGYLAFGTRDSGGGTSIERARIDSSGRLGIGTVSPNTSSGLDVLNGEICARGIRAAANKPISGVWLGKASGGNATVEIIGDTGTTAEIDFSVPNTDYKGRIGYDLTSDYMYFSTNVGERMRIDSSGRMTMGGAVVFSTGGNANINSTFNIDVTVRDDSGSGNGGPYKVLAGITHVNFSSYGAAYEAWVACRGTSVNETLTQQNTTSAQGGSWSVSKPANTTLRVTHTGGSLSALANYFVIVFAAS